MQMRKIMVGATHCILALFIGLPAVPLQANEQSQTQKQEAVQSESAARSDSSNTTATKDSSSSKKDAVKVAASPEGDLASLKEQILSQQKQIEALMASLEAQKQALEKELKTHDVSVSAGSGSATASSTVIGTIQADQQKLANLELINGELEALADSAAQSNQRLSKIEADTAAYNKANDAKTKQFGNFNFSGDIRVRYEPFYQQGAVDRHRERFRVRLNMTGKVSDEISGGLSLATGSLEDPVSTNQTFTNFFNRKNFNIDKAWITYRPNYAKSLKLDAGKFACPWYRTELTFDNDLNPEGFAETLSFDTKNPVLKNITMVGFQLPVLEVGSGYDSYVVGGQIQAQFRLGGKARLGLYGTGVSFHRADPIAIALNAALVPSLPNSNTLRVNTAGTVVGYASKFAYFDAIVRLDLNTTSARFPMTLQFDFVNNTRGPRERSGYWTDLIIGKLSNPKDVQFTYSFIRIEKDAVIGAFNASDMRSSTNVRNHRLQAGYQIKSNVTAQFTAWIGKLANPLDNVSLVPPGVRSACTGANTLSCVDPYLKRLQFDLIYKF